MANKIQRESKKNKPKRSIKEKKAAKKAKRAAATGAIIPLPKPAN